MKENEYISASSAETECTAAENAVPEAAVPESVETPKKPKRRITDNFVAFLIVAYLLIFFGQLLGTILVEVPITVPRMIGAIMSGASLEEIIANGVELPPLLETVSMYLMPIGVWIVCMLWFIKKNNRPLYRVLGTAEKGNTVPMFLFGLLIGAGMNGLCILGAYLNGNIALHFDSFKPLQLLLIFVCVFIQSSSEELVCRGYLYRKLLGRYNPTVAILVSSVFFSLLHIGNPGVGVVALLDIFFSGLLFALMVYYFDSIWCAFAAHTAWNFTQNIVFGLPNSGMTVPVSILKLDTPAATDSFFYNVGFGVEGTVFAVLVEAAVCVLIFLWGRQRVKKAPRTSDAG